MQQDQTQAYGVIVITHFEHLGEITVRPRTNRDIMNTIPTLTDQRLVGNMNPSMTSRYNAALEAAMDLAVVQPEGIVDIILDSENPRDLRVEVGKGKNKKQINVFQQFSEEYEQWIADMINQASEKKSGPETMESGNESAS